MSARPAAALLFDLDGTIVDSDGEHLAAFQKVFAAHGVALDRAAYVAGIMGSSNAIIGEKFLPHLSPLQRAEALERKESLYREGFEALAPVRGLEALFDYADGRGFPRALVTNAPRANVVKVLAALGLTARIAEWIIGPELERAKPDPLPYVTALRRLGADAERSVAFEDSLSGMRAALGAGLAAVGVTTGLGASQLLEAGAALAIADFADPRLRPFIEARTGVALARS